MVKTVTAQEFISKAIEMSPLTQREIANKAGYDKPNVLSMMKNGITKIPIAKVPELARACGVDEKNMLRVVLQDYYPEVWAILSKNFEMELLTDEERRLVQDHRAKKDEGFEGSPIFAHKEVALSA
jgi:transcriptional regulator with XRE-family HTH domain